MPQHSTVKGLFNNTAARTAAAEAAAARRQALRKAGAGTSRHLRVNNGSEERRRALREAGAGTTRHLNDSAVTGGRRTRKSRGLMSSVKKFFGMTRSRRGRSRRQ
jgi:hypothetical protein